MSLVKINQSTDEVVLNIDVNAEIHQTIEELQLKLPKLKNFYQNSKIPIRITGKILEDDEKTMIQELIDENLDVTVTFDGVSDLLGLHAIKKTFQTDTEISETKYVQNSLRSGMKEEFRGSIVIFGDVNAGAEIIAGGNIAILGTLRGLAHAGANGNVKAVISANSIDVTQIRIANLVREVEEKVDRFPVCKIKNNTITIE